MDRNSVRKDISQAPKLIASIVRSPSVIFDVEINKTIQPKRYFESSQARRLLFCEAGALDAIFKILEMKCHPFQIISRKGVGFLEINGSVYSIIVLNDQDDVLCMQERYEHRYRWN